MNIYLALVHYPVLNKHGEIVTTSVTNLDLHDLGRLSVTYGLKKCFIVTPNSSQQNMVEYLKDYWDRGCGGDFHPTRREALNRLQVARDIEETRLTIEKAHDKRAQLVATSARKFEKTICFKELRGRFQSDQSPYLILLGTGWGLAPEVMEQVDLILDPIRGSGDYNHLSVRSAASIILDRLLGEE